MTAHPTNGMRRELAGVVVTGHRLDLPLDHDDPGGLMVDVFAREVAAHDAHDRPVLVLTVRRPGV